MFSDTQLRGIFEQLRGAVRATLVNDPTADRLGLSRIATHVQPITRKQLGAIPVGAVTITCACGGTNWIFTVTRKTEQGDFVSEQPFVRNIPESERIHTFASLIQIIADEITHVAEAYALRNTQQLSVAVSFGFPQTNIVLPNGDVDARITSRALPKMWRITDCDESLAAENQPSFTAMLRDALHKTGIDIGGKVVFVNDTTAVMLDSQSTVDTPTLPMGCVFGTGANAAVYTAGDPESGIINLESGRARVVPADAASLLMAELDWTGEYPEELEHWIGGAYLHKRVAVHILNRAEEFTHPEQLAQAILASHQQSLISDIAFGTPAAAIGIAIDSNDYALLQAIAKDVLTSIGQLIGMDVAAVAAAVEYRNGSVVVPYEGSLYTKGFGIAETAMRTVGLLIPGADIHMTHVSGMRGVAKLALALTHQAPQ